MLVDVRRAATRRLVYVVMRLCLVKEHGWSWGVAWPANLAALHNLTISVGMALHESISRKSDSPLESVMRALCMSS
jgi:hypothetical protein